MGIWCSCKSKSERKEREGRCNRVGKGMSDVHRVGWQTFLRSQNMSHKKRKERWKKNGFDLKTTIGEDSYSKPRLTLFSPRTSLQVLTPHSHDEYSNRCRKRCKLNTA